MIKKLTESSPWVYLSHGGELRLVVTLKGKKSEYTGYTRFKNSQGILQPWTVPNESRLSGLVEVSLIEEAGQNVLLGPVLLSASISYDYDPEYNADNLVGFSLGQYNFIENAGSIAEAPLYERLSGTIVNYITDSW